MKTYEKIVKNALVSEGVMLGNWRFTATPKNVGSYNFCEMHIDVFKPRCRKPETSWIVPYDMTRNLLHWCDAELVYNRAWEMK